MMYYDHIYGKPCRVTETPRVLDAWMQEHAIINEDSDDLVVMFVEGTSLQFVPAFDLLVPHVAELTAVKGLDADIIRVELAIYVGKWNTEFYEEVLRKEDLPRLLRDFFGIVDEEKELVVPVNGLQTTEFLGKRERITYPPCTCRGCDSPICPVKRRRQRQR
jgi:hypothetical protein